MWLIGFISYQSQGSIHSLIAYTVFMFFISVVALLMKISHAQIKSITAGFNKKGRNTETLPEKKIINI